MQVLKSDQVKAIDKYAIDALEIPGIILMENAALKVLKHIDLIRYSKYAIIAGTGNNGADALALARHILNFGHQVEIYILGQINRENKDYMTYYNILLRLGIEFKTITTIEDLENFREDLEKVDLIIDGIFGTGISSQVKGVQEYVIDMINNSGKAIVSIDIPSGLDGNTGKIMGICVHPNKTVTFQFLKEGLVDNEFVTGEVVVESISIPQKAVDMILK